MPATVPVHEESAVVQVACRRQASDVMPCKHTLVIWWVYASMPEASTLSSDSFSMASPSPACKQAQPSTSNHRQMACGAALGMRCVLTQG